MIEGKGGRTRHGDEKETMHWARCFVSTSEGLMEGGRVRKKWMGPCLLPCLLYVHD